MHNKKAAPECAMGRKTSTGCVPVQYLPPRSSALTSHLLTSHTCLSDLVSDACIN